MIPFVHLHKLNGTFRRNHEEDPETNVIPAYNESLFTLCLPGTADTYTENLEHNKHTPKQK